jgi:uncharacterized protein (UPF0216 family)
MIGDSLHLDKSLMQMNSSVPVSRRSLLDYSENGDLFFSTRDGARCEISKGEIDYLDDICTEIERMRLKLPILISTDCSGDITSWKVEGRTETAVIARVLGKNILTEDHLRFYNPDLKRLRSVLPTCTAVTFLP